MAVELVLAIVANLIVFLALLALVDSVIGYMGGLIGQNNWSFEVRRMLILLKVNTLALIY